MSEEQKTEEQTSSQETEEQKPDETVEVSPSKEEVSEDPKTQTEETSDSVSLTKEEHEALTKKAEDGDNYKKEAEGYRTQNKKDRLKEQPLNQNTDVIYNDYRSKLANVNGKIREEVLGLTDEQWEDAEHKINGALDSVYHKASNNGTMVSEYDLEKEAKSIISFVKGDENKKKELEKAKLDGTVEAQKADSAEIVGGNSSSAVKKSTKVAISDEARVKAEQSGGELTEEDAQGLIDNKKKRDKEYSAEY